MVVADVTQLGILPTLDLKVTLRDVRQLIGLETIDEQRKLCALRAPKRDRVSSVVDDVIGLRYKTVQACAGGLGVFSAFASDTTPIVVAKLRCHNEE